MRWKERREGGRERGEGGREEREGERRGRERGEGGRGKEKRERGEGGREEREGGKGKIDEYTKVHTSTCASHFYMKETTRGVVTRVHRLELINLGVNLFV